MKNLENIIELAANLIIKGEATETNALQMAIELDNNRCLNITEDIKSMRRGYVNDNNTNQKGFNIILNSVYNELSIAQ